MGVTLPFDVKSLEQAIGDTLDSYENNQTWSSADLFIEYAEAHGGMGSDSEYRPIDRIEFAERLYKRLANEAS